MSQLILVKRAVSEYNRLLFFILLVAKNVSKNYIKEKYFMINKKYIKLFTKKKSNENKRLKL